ncbi:hypothetical protein KRC45_002595 [Enterococcus faecium]|nr:hypothetical protein [Enterococcus faecium]
MPKKNELNAGMEIDSQETFGELLFLRMKSAKTEIDEDTGFCCKVFQKIYFSVKLRKKTERTE